uniref:Uncharacterized protein n=1 Tax=Knipowitschia caucasica TaxID=637954 RepID=A0AAV2IW99_KNICA
MKGPREIRKETGRDGHGRTGRARRREQATEEDHERDPSSAKEANREAIYTQRRGSYPAYAVKVYGPGIRGGSWRAAIRIKSEDAESLGRTAKRPTRSGGAHTPPAPLRRQDRENPPSESALRDQLLLGLSDSPLAQALKVYARRHPELDFTELREEARLLETEYGRGQPEVTCASVQKHYDSPKTPQGLDWKEQLKREIMEEVNVQMKGLSRDILAELKPLLQSASPQSSPPNTTWNRRYSPRPYNDRDEQGMNVIMACWDNIFKRSKMPALPPQFKHLRVWREAFATCSRIEVAPTEDGSMGFVRLATKNNISVPPNSEIVVWGRTRMGRGGTDFCALIEPVPGANIGGVGVARTLVEVRKGRVPVRICNPHPYSVSVGRFTRLGQLYHIEEADVHGPNDPSLFLEGDDVVAVTLVDVTTSAANSELPPEVSKLKTRPDLSEVQQEELEALLQRWEKVFAVHDEDFGRTDLVQHRIPTGDAAPIRERHRPIPPMLYREAIPPVDELVDAAAVETGRDGHGRTGRARRREQATEEDHERDPSSAKEANREAIYTQRRGSYPAYAVSLRPWDPRRQLEGCNPDKERGRRVTGTYREATYTQRRGSYPACAVKAVCAIHIGDERRLPASGPPLNGNRAAQLSEAMAQAGPGTLLHRRNIRLDSFLKRNTGHALFERIRTYEPCVVQSDSFNKVYMHVVMSDERVYLTEFSPRTLTCAFGFRSVRSIELINDHPDFLSGKDRELCQHIKVIYVPEKPASKRNHEDHLFNKRPPTLKSEGHAAHRPTRSASCPDGETLLGLVPQPPERPHSSASMYPLSSHQHATNSPSPKVSRRMALLFSRLFKQNKMGNIAELHLYALSPFSTLYVNLQSSWTSFIIKSTLMLDPIHCRKYCTSPCLSTENYPQRISWEQTAHLFSQLQTEVLQKGIREERLYLLLQELCTAAHRNITLRRLFWKSNALCPFLVQTLEDCLPGDQSAVYTTDNLLMGTLVIQTLAVMFRETEVEPARLILLSANNGALASRMLLALVCDPQPQSPNAPQIDTCLIEYLDAACSLFFELLLQGQEKSKFSISESILSVGWIFQVLQPHPHLLSFFGYQAQQVVLVLSSSHHYVSSPAQAVLLFQRCRLLLASLQYSKHLTQHLMSNFRDDFKYSVNIVDFQMKIPPHYLISPLIRQQVDQILTLILH